MDSGVRDILIGMKAALSEGWIKGSIQTAEGVCLFGALVKATNLPTKWGISGCLMNDIKGRTGKIGQLVPVTEVLDGSNEMKAIRLIAKEVGVYVLDLALWNDEDERQVDDITSAIDRILLRDATSKRPLRREKEEVAA